MPVGGRSHGYCQEMGYCMRIKKRFNRSMKKALNWYERIVWFLVGNMMVKHGYKYLTVMKNEKEVTAFIFDSIERSYVGD